VPKVLSAPPYQLFNEDCFQTLARIQSASVDMVMVDPPYGTTACSWDSVIPLPEMWCELERVIRPNGAMVFTASQPFTTTLIGSNLNLFRYCWYWSKSNVTGFANAKIQPLRCVEEVVVFYKNRPTYNPQGLLKCEKRIKENDGGAGGKTLQGDNTKNGKGGLRSGDSYKQEFTNYPRQILEIGKVTLGIHPTEKPVKLMDYLIRTYTNEGDTVLDFAMGSGTTGVAAMHLGRNFIGCDSDTENGYFETAELRIKTAWRQAQQKRPSIEPGRV